MDVLDWIFLVIGVGVLVAIGGVVTYLVGAKHGFREGWDTGRDALRDDFRYRRDQMDKIYAECQAQRDSAQADLAAAHVERDKLKAELGTIRAAHRKQLEAEQGVLVSERDAAIARRDKLASECERLARCLDWMVLDLGKMEAAARTISGRSEVMEERMVAATDGKVGGTAVGDDGPGDDDDEPEDEDEDDMDDDDLDIDDYDEDDSDDIDTCPDCGEDWDDCGCDDDDDDDLSDDDDDMEDYRP